VREKNAVAELEKEIRARWDDAATSQPTLSHAGSAVGCWVDDSHAD
jgi:hypothetical protein